MGNTKAYTGIGWVPFKHNLSLKFVEMKMRAESFLKEKEDERKKWDKWRWELSPSWKKKRMKGRNETNEDENSVLPERKRGWKGEMKQMKMRAQSFLKEKENEREKWDKYFFAQMKGRSEINLFAQICETILSAFIEYFLQKL